MTAPRPPMPPRSAKTTRPGRLSRWKLTEPVRLYLYSLAVVALAGLTLGGVVSGEWSDYVVHALGVLLVVPAAEAARASVYSPASHVRDVFRAVSEAKAGPQLLDQR